MKTSACGSLILLVFKHNISLFSFTSNSVTVRRIYLFKFLSTTFQINYNYTVQTLSTVLVHNENKTHLFLMLFDFEVLFFHHSLSGCKSGKLKETDVLIIWTPGSLSLLMSTVLRY